MMELTCSGCGRAIWTRHRHAGERATCPFCNAELTVARTGGPRGRWYRDLPYRRSAFLSTLALAFGCGAVFSLLMSLPAVLFAVAALMVEKEGRKMAMVGLLLGLLWPTAIFFYGLMFRGIR